MVNQVENDADEEISGYRMKYLKQVQEQKSLNIELEAEINTLKRKEGRIRDMGQQNEELKKLNFLLKHDVTEKERKLKPLEEENNTLHRQSKSLEEKIAQFDQNNRNLRCKMKALQLQVRAIEDERGRAREQANFHEIQLARYRMEVGRLMQRIQTPNQLKEGIIALYRQQVVSTEAVVSPEPDRSVFDSYGTHLEHSEAKIQALRDKMTKEINFHKVNYRKILKEHSDLIQEINELRREVSSSRVRLRDFEIYFGISSIDITESAAARAKIEEALRLEKEGKKQTEKAILDRDKVIVNQGVEIRKLHNIMRFEEVRLSNKSLLPPITEGKDSDPQEAKPEKLELDTAQDEGQLLQNKQGRDREVDEASADSFSDQDDDQKT